MEIRDTLKLLSFPFEISTLEAIDSLKFKFAAVILHEDLLDMELPQLNIDDVANTVVLVCNSPSAPQVLYQRYKIIAEECIPRSAAPDDIFRCIQNVICTHRPRKISKEDYLDVVNSIHDSSSSFKFPAKHTIGRQIPFGLSDYFLCIVSLNFVTLT